MQCAFNAGALKLSLPAISAGEPLVGIALGIVVFGDRIQISSGELAIEAGGIVALIVGVIMVGRAPALSQLRAWTPPSISVPRVPHVTHPIPSMPSLPSLPGMHLEQPEQPEPGERAEPGGRSRQQKRAGRASKTNKISEETQPGMHGLRHPSPPLGGRATGPLGQTRPQPPSRRIYPDKTPRSN